MTYSHDAIVIGAGSAGLTAAGGIALFGRLVALVEAGAMGGECLNTGCVPSKALLAAAARAHALEGERFGIRAGAPQIDFARVRAHVRAAIAAIAPHDSQGRFEAMGVEVIRARASLLGSGKVLAGNRELAAPRIVIATGSKPAIPPIAGLAGMPYFTNETIWDLASLPQHLAVVGAGPVGMEMAQAFRRLGAQVTVISRGRPLPRDDEEAAALVRAQLEAEGVRFIEAELERVSGSAGTIRLQTGDQRRIEVDQLLIATGRKANVEGLGLESAGVELGEDGIEVDARRRTSNKRIYAIGDCRAGPRFTHVSGYEGSNVALEIALAVPAKVDYAALPWCTFTDPELAQVGLTEAQAREKHGDEISVIREHFDHNDRAVTEGRPEGFAKVVMKGRRVLGATVVGHNAGELLLPFAQAITGKSSSFALGSAIVAYPTRAEIAKAAAFSAWEPTVFGRAPKGWAALVSRMRRGLG